MTSSEKLDVYNTAVSAASRHGAVITSLLLKCAEESQNGPDQKPAEGNYIDQARNWFDEQDQALTAKANDLVGTNAGRYLSTGAWGGLGLGLLGLLREYTSGKKKKSYWDAFWRHAMPGFFGGIGGQYLYNNYHGLDKDRAIVSDANQAGAAAVGDK